MFDIDLFLQSLLGNTYIQLVSLFATLIGGGSAIDYFWQQRKVEKQQAIINNSLICRWFPQFCFRRAYQRHLVYEHCVFNIKGLRTRGTYTIELEQVFVELRIAPSTAPNQSHRDLLTIKELQGNKPIWEFLRYSKIAKSQLLLAIIGAPGCGKTTLLQHIALTLVTKPPRGLPKWLPILLFLRQQVKTIVANRPLLAKIVQQHFANPNRYPDLEPPANWFHQQLQAGRCLVLLDGLDEVANAEERKYISAWIDEQIVNYPRCAFIVTSRPQGYHAASLARATVVLEVQAFTMTQVRQFIAAWYLATEIMSFGGKADAGVRLRARQEAEDLHQRLRTRPALLALTVNPLLLTMIAMVHRYRGQLPGRRVELYAEICDVLLGHWREAKGIQDNLTAAQKRVALQPLAAEMMAKSVREIKIADAIKIIREPLQTVGIAESDFENFLKDIQASSGLFAEREIGVWSFAHLTFQEYLAAAHFKEQKIHGNWWQRKVADSWWQETLRLYAAQADATPIVTACLHNQNVMTLTLAADCLEEALKLEALVRQQVEELLIANLEADNPELFKIAAEVKLQRRLKNLHRIDETREIDVEFISCAEYQLFLDEMRLKGKFYQPDHWRDYHFVKGSAEQPIVGVRATAAVEFCKWLSEREQVKYRLPQLEELKNSVPNKIEFATWYDENGIYKLSWTSKEHEKEIKKKLEKYSELRPVFIGNYKHDIDIEINFSKDLEQTISLNCAFKVNKWFDKAVDSVLKWWYVLLVIMLLVLIGWDNSLKAIYYGLLFGIPFAAVAIWIYRQASKQPQFQKILSLDLKIAKYSFEGNIDSFGREDMQNSLETIKEISRSKFYKNNCGKTAREQLDVLINDLSKIFAEITDPRLAKRKFFEQITKYIYYDYNQKQLNWLEKLFPRGMRKRIKKNNQRKQMIWQLHWWFVVTNARQASKLPAWEGIRIVRNRTSESVLE
jgi:energy-coupling factor transporter ATP-binding protein EcfA2